MPVIKSVLSFFAPKCGFDAIRAESDAHRQESAGDAFREAHQIWRNAREIARKHFPGPAKSRKHFIGDQQHITLCAKRPHLPQKLHRVNNHPSSALQKWFDDYRRDFVAPLREQRLELQDAFDLARFAL
jgi:hypothetical protein